MSNDITKNINKLKFKKKTSLKSIMINDLSSYSKIASVSLKSMNFIFPKYC